MFCQDVMLSVVHTCHPADSARSCAQVMASEHIGMLPVVDERDRLVGVVTDRDLALRVLGQGLPWNTQVGDVMSGAPLLTCSPHEDLHAVEARMGKLKKTRALVVDAQERCVGIISLSDVARFEDDPHAGRLLREVTQRESVHIVRAQSHLT